MEEFIGFNKIIDGFTKRVEKGTLSHAHLIVGPNGIGKSILAKIFSLRILGKDIDQEYVDIINYRPHKASFGVDEVREIIDEVNKKPYEGDKKVIIIHQGDKLTVQAQNTLLKTIEEPPKGVYIILLSESLELLLETIKSRCQVYKLTPLGKEEVIKYIRRLGQNDETLISAAVSYSGGIPGRAEKFLQDDKLEKLREIIINLLADIEKKDNNTVIEYEDKFSKYKEDKEEVLNLLSSFIRDIIVYKEIENRDIIINADKFNDIAELSNSLSYKKLNLMMERIEEARRSLNNNNNYKITISIMLMGFLEG